MKFLLNTGEEEIFYDIFPCGKPDGTGQHIIASQIWVRRRVTTVDRWMQNRHFWSCDFCDLATYTSVWSWTQTELSKFELACTKKTCRSHPHTEWWWWGIVQGKRLMNHHMDKVFSWLNRKIRSNAEYCTIDGNKGAMEKEDCARGSVAEQDTEALLLRDVGLNGILAIGTLGHNVNSFFPEACSEQDDDFIVMDSKKVAEEMYEEEKSGAMEDALATAPIEAPAPAAELAEMHSSSLKECNFTCSLKCNFTCSVKEEILMFKAELEDATKIQEQPVLMVEKEEKVRTTLADLFAAEPLSSSDTGEKSYPKVAIAAETPTSRPASCMEKVHQKKSARKPPNATRKLSGAMRKMLGKKIHPEQLNRRSNVEDPLIA